MELAYSATVAVFLIIVGHSNGVPGDPVMYLPALEVRTIDPATRFNPSVPFINPQFPSFQPVNQRPSHQHQIIHTQQPATQILEKPQSKKHNFTFNEFVDALNQLEDKEEDDSEVEESRAARDPSPYPPANPSYSPYGYGPYSRPYGYGQRPPSYGPWSPPYHEPAAYVPPTAVHHPSKKTELLKPFSTKVAGKVSGLIGLVLGLLTGSPGNFELHGFKDILINGIVKPLLVAKGGVKSLISKLTIPVISLLLINLEVLITIWWLWEDCPEPSHEKPVYPAYSSYPSYPKPSYNYNSYR